MPSSYCEKPAGADVAGVKRLMRGTGGLRYKSPSGDWNTDHHNIEVARTYYKWHGSKPPARLVNADIDAVEHFFTRIIEKRPFTMAKDAA